MNLQQFRCPLRDERGSLALELVVLTPVLVLTLWIVGALTLRAMVAHAQVDSAARDAARAASIARSVPAARHAAASAAANSLQQARRTCQAIHVTTDTERFRPGGTVQVTVTCTIRLQDLGLSFLLGNRTTSATYAVPMDVNRGIHS
jgi:Flp pilus assembly protein TadG